MTAATRDLPQSTKLGAENIPDPVLIPLLTEANVLIFAGTMVATNAAGYAVPASASSALVIWGRCEQQVDNRGGAQGAKPVSVRQGPYFQNQDGTITQANIGHSAYAVDDNTVSSSSSGGTRPYAGKIMPGQRSPSTNQNAPLTASSQVAVWLGQSTPYP